MVNVSNSVAQSSADLSLWFKVRSGDPLNLADVPEMIPLRWNYFRNMWVDIKQRLSRKASSASDPDYFRSVLEDMNTFIETQRTASTDKNPFSGSDIYYRFYPVFDAITVEQISLTTDEQKILEGKKASIQAFSKNDFLKIKRNLKEYRDQLADSVGLGDPDYNRIYNRGVAIDNKVGATIANLNLMQMLQDQLASVDFILANLFAVDAAVDPFALARINANNPEIPIGQYSSGYLVKIHYGEDLQGLATRYLGDPNKWIDIALANGLREPYIDEVGEQFFLLSNGRKNQVNVLKTSSSRFYVNQLVFIQSNTLPFPSQRNISAIKEIPHSSEVVLTLSGEADLDNYLLNDQANIRVFKPNTVNSSQYLLIPSTEPLDSIRKDEIPWFQTGSQADEKKAKIDIAISENGALQFTPNGDIALSYGLANAIQATKLKLMTELGSNRYHPNYGIINLTGTTNLNEASAKATLINSINSQIQADPRFDRVESLTVERHKDTTTTAYLVNLVVRLAGGNTLLPISFTVAV